MFRVIYWSTRQKAGISDPYGQSDHDDEEKANKLVAGLMKDCDIYRVELWQLAQIKSVSKPPIVEKRHGNKAHLKLKGATMEEEECG